MKNILIMSGTYYPDSMATIGITQRLAESLVSKGYHVCVYTVRYCNHKNPGYPKEHNGVQIFDTADFSVTLTKKFKNKDYAVEIRRKTVKRLKKLLKKDKLTNYLHYKLYRKQRENFLGEIEAEKIEQLLNEQKIDTVISVALPFVVHRYASIIKKRNPNVKWIPVSFDPYAYDEVTNAHQKEACILEEEEVLSYADRIMFLTQFEKDYVDSPLKEKIEYFELPNIRKVACNPNYSSVAFEKGKINCVFLGNLYLIQRHPEFLFRMFSLIKNENIVLHIIGDLVDIPKEYIDKWCALLEDRLFYTGRIGQTEAINAMLKADILINIGHSTTNQCPSKILDYMNTGKPILSIRKIENCTSIPYLDKYPLALSVSENEILSEEQLKEIEEFILDNRDASLAFEFVENMFNGATMENMIRKLELI